MFTVGFWVIGSIEVKLTRCRNAAKVAPGYVPVSPALGAESPMAKTLSSHAEACQLIAATGGLMRAPKLNSGLCVGHDGKEVHEFTRAMAPSLASASLSLVVVVHPG